jgi:hypothetical protein
VDTNDAKLLGAQELGLQARANALTARATLRRNLPLAYRSLRSSFAAEGSGWYSSYAQLPDLWTQSAARQQPGTHPSSAFSFGGAWLCRAEKRRQSACSFDQQPPASRAPSTYLMATQLFTKWTTACLQRKHCWLPHHRRVQTADGLGVAVSTLCATLWVVGAIVWATVPSLSSGVYQVGLDVATSSQAPLHCDVCCMSYVSGALLVVSVL